MSYNKNRFRHLLMFALLLLTSCFNDGKSNNPSSEHESLNSEHNSFVTTGEDVTSADSIISSSEEESNEVTSEELVMKRESYTNPLYDRDYPDPSGVYDPIQRAWFLYATGGRILKSTDGVTFTPVAYAFQSIPAWGTPGAGLWAPEVQYIGGQYVMYYSLSVWGDNNPGIGVATAPRPEGPWTDRGKLFRSLEIGVNNSIDPGVFISEDGKVYMIWGSMRGNYIVELTSDGLALKDGSPENASVNKIRVAGLDTAIGWTVDTYEAAYVRYFNGYYYLFLSMGTCCEGVNSTYQVVVSRSTSPTGPYVDHLNREMTARNVGKLVIQKNDFFVGTGHNSVIDDVNGEPWFYYHAFHKEGSGSSRVLLMERLLFDEAGWPYVQGFEASKTQRIGPYYFKEVA